MVILSNAAGKSKQWKLGRNSNLPGLNQHINSSKNNSYSDGSAGRRFFLVKIKRERKKEREMHPYEKSPLLRWHFNKLYLIKIKKKIK